MQKTPTETQITYKKNGEIKKITTPYDDDSILQKPIHSLDMESHNILSNIFKSYGEAYLMNFNN